MNKQLTYQADLQQLKVIDNNVTAAALLFPDLHLTDGEHGGKVKPRCTHGQVDEMTRVDFEYLTGIDATKFADIELEILTTEYLDYCESCGYHLKSEHLEIIEDEKGQQVCTNCHLPF